jgi:hypothetical protein
MAREWHGAQANGDVLLALPATTELAEGGAEGGEVAMKRRMRTRLEDDIAFGIEDESAHISDDRAAAGQKHTEDQTDEGLAAVGQVVEDLAALDLPQSDAVGGNRPFNVAVHLDADGVAGGVIQDLDGLDAADLKEDAFTDYRRWPPRR